MIPYYQNPVSCFQEDSAPIPKISKICEDLGNPFSTLKFSVTIIGSLSEIFVNFLVLTPFKIRNDWF